MHLSTVHYFFRGTYLLRLSLVPNKKAVNTKTVEWGNREIIGGCFVASTPVVPTFTKLSMLPIVPNYVCG